MKRGRRSVYSATFCEWEKTAAKLKDKGINIYVSKELEQMCNTSQRLAKWDIADFTISMYIGKLNTNGTNDTNGTDDTKRHR